MLIDVRPILHIPGKELNFQFELDLSDMEFGGRNPISRPVIVEGAVRNRAEVLYLDLAELARDAFILDMDTKTLCSEDCKGLCPHCGADLNLGPCSCKKDVDPRLAVLAKLLENK